MPRNLADGRRRLPFGEAFAGVRVVQAADSFPGRLCGKLIADAGADVVTIVTPGADGVEGPFAADWSAYLDLGKRSSGLSATPGGDLDTIDDLLRDADLFVTSSLHDDLDALACHPVLARHPHLTVACVTPFGQDGPNHEYLADDVVLSALAGLADATPGFPDHRDRDDEPPAQSLAPFAEMVGGLSAAVAVFATLVARFRGSEGPRHVEASSLEANVAAMVWEWGLTSYGGGIRGRRPRRADLAPNCYLPCRDGMVILVAFTEAHWNGLVDLMGRPDWALDPRFADPIARSESWDLLEPRLRSWAAQQSGREVLEAAQARGLPCCCTLELGELLDAEQVRHNGSVTIHEGRPLPSNPIVVSAAEGGSDVDERPPRPSAAAPTPSAPLAGIRVLDLGQAVAGPYAAQLLAALGAEVTLVEPPGIPTSRRFAPFAGTPTHDASNTFNHVNRGKTSVQLDLTTDAGQDVLRTLVADSDVVLENFSARAARQLHLSFAELSAVRSDVVLASISAFGRSGPWGNYVALHSGVLTLGGVADVTRDEEGRMRLPGAVYPDLVTANWTALAIVEALAARLVHGRGCHVQISMLDVLLNTMGGLLPSAAVGRRSWRHPASFLPAVDGFVAVSDDVPVDVRAAVAGAAKAEAMEELQRRGFHAGAVLDIGEVMADPHLAQRGFLLADDHPVAGPRPVPAVPWKLDGRRPELRHAPLLGEATQTVLARVAERTAGARS